MKRLNIAFYISGKATRLCEIIKDERFVELKSSLKFVLSDNLNESEEIYELCNINNIDWIYYDYKGLEESISRKEKNRSLSNNILDELKKYEIDYLFVFGHHLLSGELLKQYKDRIICFHPSLLPHFTGFGGIDQAVENGDFVIGNSAFLIDEGVDTGKVIIQSVMHISNFNNNNYNRLLQPIVDMFYYIVRILLEDRLMVYEEKVVIENANYEKVKFFPSIEE